MRDYSLDNFLDHYGPLSVFTESDKREITAHLTFISSETGTILVREGQTHHYVYFLVQGAVRSFYLKDGVEVNTWFAFENDIVGSFQNYLGRPSKETIALLEDCCLVAINLSTLKPQVSQSLPVSNFVRHVIEEYTGFLEERLFKLQFTSGMDRYRYLVENEPETFHRVPLTYIASYLGFTRETLSRLRAKTIL